MAHAFLRAVSPFVATSNRTYKRVCAHADKLVNLAEPNAEVNPRWWTLRVTKQDGTVVEGLRMGEDTFSLRLMDAQENLRSFSKVGVRSHERIKDSTMPSYAQSLTAQEVDDLVAYLFSLRTER